ncbi:hypothetical protein BSL78_05668 [Apostichopus japonicus]|uniref:HECT domain-containing protein n=1 Tax=Stichopus japonicus TaxID=307972 RepID=A0A2G8LAX8_STIJA|nr:hypothetical protein BSL78_05668 [Apostichopus japonicus]
MGARMQKASKLFYKTNNVTLFVLNSVRKRGRKKEVTWKAKVFLFRRCNPDFFPSPNEVKHLSESGYGFTKEAAKIIRTWAKPQLEEYIHACFPNAPLGLVGFDLGHCDKARVVKKIEFQTIKELEGKVGKGKVLIIPRRDLPGVSVHSEGLASGTPTVSFNPQRGNQQDSASTPHTSGVHDSTSIDVTPSRTDDTTASGVNLTLPAVPSSSSATLSSVSLLDTVENGEPPLIDLDFDVEDNTTISALNDVPGEVKEAFSTLHMSLLEEREIKIRRAHLMEDVMAAYSDENLCLHKLKVTFEGESGDDFGGLTKEMLTLFWIKASQNFFHGENVTVPSIPLYRFRKEGTKYNNDWKNFGTHCSFD